MAADKFPLLLLYRSPCCCCIMVGEGEIPVEPGIKDASIMFPFILDNASWPALLYIIAIKYSTIDSASSADNCTKEEVAGSSSPKRASWNSRKRKFSMSVFVNLINDS